MEEQGKFACSCEGTDPVADPDCLRCMRRQLRALQVVVFFHTPDGAWRLGNFQGDRPYEDAEAQFQYFLQCGLPEVVESQGKGFILSDDQSIERLFPGCKEAFRGNCLIAVPVVRGGLRGIRMAWREQDDPFQPSDLETLECCGRCQENGG